MTDRPNDDVRRISSDDGSNWSHTHHREALSARRRSETLSFWHLGTRYHATVGFYDDGRPGEVFLDAAKAGTEREAIARDAAVTVSLALQFGAPLDTIRRAMTREGSGAAAGAMGVLLDMIAAGPPPADIPPPGTRGALAETLERLTDGGAP
ncbi:hypothetical protein ACFQ4O_02050 [Methylopila musalis]|uniref:ribonucleoside-diphosphate reductase n=1 Tax=Methylopila musalis TaxID=1134781 RepID=A0ABW3Z3J8_9HYPH